MKNLNIKLLGLSAALLFSINILPIKILNPDNGTRYITLGSTCKDKPVKSNMVLECKIAPGKNIPYTVKDEDKNLIIKKQITAISVSDKDKDALYQVSKGKLIIKK